MSVMFEWVNRISINHLKNFQKLLLHQTFGNGCRQNIVARIFHKLTKSLHHYQMSYFISESRIFFDYLMCDYSSTYLQGYDVCTCYPRHLTLLAQFHRVGVCYCPNTIDPALSDLDRMMISQLFPS